jgi:hypothetical protein
LTHTPSHTESFEHVRRTQPARQSKFAGHGLVSLHARGTQRWFAAHARPSPQPESSAQPATQLIVPSHVHRATLQMKLAPCAVHSVSCWQVTGGIMHAPQPMSWPGAKHSSKDCLQSACDRQHA